MLISFLKFTGKVYLAWTIIRVAGKLIARVAPPEMAAIIKDPSTIIPD